MNIVMIIPTGIGCVIGGHAGDANPVAKLLGACCDKLLLHPNVVNASDINEMPSNALYVEGSILDRFLEGTIRLKEVVRPNKILIVINEETKWITNAVNAAKHTIGVDATILKLKTPLKMVATKSGPVATGEVIGWEDLCKQVSTYSFDALAINTPIDCKKGVALHYYENGGVNPWGGVEALASRLIATELNKPVAHAPILEDDFMYDEIVNPRMAAEVISSCFLHCVLKGLHRAPHPYFYTANIGLSVDEIDLLVSPYHCWGRPHKACVEKKIPILIVKENTTVFYLDTYYKHYVDLQNNNITFVNTYLEAAGHIVAMQAGVTPQSTRA